MKLKSIVVALLSASALTGLSATSYASGMTIINKTNVANLYVACNGGARVATFPYAVPWNLVSSIFLGGQTSGTCNFYNAISGGSYLGQGDINMNSQKTLAVVNHVSTIDGYDAVLTTHGSTYNQVDMVDEVTITLTGNGPSYI
ncbi:hypothetical protein L3V83_12900 [Thiotrichales bacterium 19X7-9]|nr:hypothetical protein [Thiotrichales bacterium 19X7-9]